MLLTLKCATELKIKFASNLLNLPELIIDRLYLLNRTTIALSKPYILLE